MGSKPSLFSDGEEASRKAFRLLRQSGIDFDIRPSHENGVPILVVLDPRSWPKRYTGITKITEWINSQKEKGQKTSQGAIK